MEPEETKLTQLLVENTKPGMWSTLRYLVQVQDCLQDSIRQLYLILQQIQDMK